LRLPPRASRASWTSENTASPLEYGTNSWRPHPERYELDEVLGTVLARLPAAMRSRVQFDLPAVPLVVDVDFTQIARAIGQLVENALAYSPPDAPVIVGASQREDVRVWVEDSGPGIDDAEKPRVFEKFYRGAASPDVPTGTGLGLAIAREIVRSHDGTLVVEDVEPHGARFVLTLPSPDEKEPS
jgi:two-component system sensor histidine kinase KdpD